MRKHIPLDDLEMFELMRAAYPEKFKDDENETWDAVMDFADTISGFDEIADLLGRVATLAMPMTSPLTGEAHHVLGSIVISETGALMCAAVKREVMK